MLSCRRWYAVQVRQRTEKLTSQLLAHKGYEPFLPTYPVKRRWSDRVKILDRPLFPGYLFCRLDPQHVRLPLLTTPGVFSILGAGNEPIPIPDAEINAVWKIVESTVSAKPWPYVACGDRVTITDGPLRGVEGTLATIKSECRVVVSVSLLKRSVAVEVERGAVMPSEVWRHIPGRVVVPNAPPQMIN